MPSSLPAANDHQVPFWSEQLAHLHCPALRQKLHICDYLTAVTYSLKWRFKDSIFVFNKFSQLPIENTEQCLIRSAVQLNFLGTFHFSFVHKKIIRLLKKLFSCYKSYSIAKNHSSVYQKSNHKHSLPNVSSKLFPWSYIKLVKSLLGLFSPSFYLLEGQFLSSSR